MSRLVAGVVAFMVAAVGPASGADRPDPAEQRAARELDRLGVSYETDEDDPRKPVVAVSISGPDLTLPTFLRALRQLRAFPRLRELEIEFAPLTDARLAFLTPLVSLESLTLTEVPVNGAGIAHLKGLKQLKCLNIQSCPVVDASLAHLKGLPGLEVVMLNETRVRGRGFQGLGNALPKLRYLSLEGEPPRDEDLAALAGLKSLDTLSLEASKVSARGLKQLAVLPSLTSLDLVNPRVTADQAQDAFPGKAGLTVTFR